jgi:hypothetical protein
MSGSLGRSPNSLTDKELENKDRKLTSQLRKKLKELSTANYTKANAEREFGLPGSYDEQYNRLHGTAQASEQAIMDSEEKISKLNNEIAPINEKLLKIKKEIADREKLNTYVNKLKKERQSTRGWYGSDSKDYDLDSMNLHRAVTGEHPLGIEQELGPAQELPDRSGRGISRKRKRHSKKKHSKKRHSKKRHNKKKKTRKR